MDRKRLAGPRAIAARIYRAIVPRPFRIAVRTRMVGPKPDPTSRAHVKAAADPKTAPGPRMFDLPLPRTDVGPAGRSGVRSSLHVEVPSQFYVTRQLHQFGVAGYEAATEAVVLGVAEAIPPTVMFDIGANVGPHALLVSALLDIPVVAFEPAPDVAAALRHIVRVNDLRCEVEEIALGRSDGTEILFISPTDTSTSMRPGFRAATAEIRVPVRSLDSYVREHGHRPGLLKLDTETTEPEVLAGASELLATRPWVVCEVLPGWTEADLESVFFPLGYLAYQIVDPLPLVAHPRLVGSSSLEGSNWLFAPEEPSTVVWQAIERWRRAIAGCPAPSDPVAAAATSGSGRPTTRAI